MAWIVSFATEHVGEHIGPAATGLLQATLGNLPELFVVLFALRAGERAVAQSAIVGSLFATALLVLGLRARRRRAARARRRDALRPEGRARHLDAAAAPASSSS